MQIQQVYDNEEEDDVGNKYDDKEILTISL